MTSRRPTATLAIFSFLVPLLLCQLGADRDWECGEDSPDWLAGDSCNSKKPIICTIGAMQLNATCSNGAVTEMNISNGQMSLLNNTEWRHFKSLRSMVVENCEGEPYSPQWWSEWSTDFEQLEKLVIVNCSLGGELPLEWNDGFPNLEELNLSNNLLDGELPEEWASDGAFPKLEILNLSNNKLRGKLPKQWAKNGSFENLMELDLSNNSLEGHVPASWVLRFYIVDRNKSIDLEDNKLCKLGWLDAYYSYHMGESFPPSWSLCKDVDNGSDPQQCRNLHPNVPARVPMLNSDLQEFTGNNETNASVCSCWRSPATDCSVYDGWRGACNRSAVCVLIVNPTVIVAPALVPPPPPPPVPSSGSSTTLAIAIAVPVFLAVAAVAGAVAVFILCKRKQGAGVVNSKKDAADSQHTNDEGADGGPTVGPTLPLSEHLQRQRAASGPPLTSVYDSGAWESESESECSTVSGPVGRLRSVKGALELQYGHPHYQYKGAATRPLQLLMSDIHISELHLRLREDGTVYKLGDGAFSEVYRGWYNNQEVAVKVLRHVIGHRAAQAALEKELKILKGLNHRNVVGLLGACLDQQLLMLILEYLHNGDLFHALYGPRAQHYLWKEMGKRVALDIACGLQYLHSEKNIVHCDLKSLNILLAKDGTAKIADMGMSKFIHATFVTKGGQLGTLAWAAPELLEDQKINEKVDIYSFGVVLWEIVTGETPERGRRRPVRVPEECPQDVADLMDRCTLRNPEDRPSADEVYHTLQKIVCPDDYTSSLQYGSLEDIKLDAIKSDHNLE